jgi:hypothetical protein
MLLAHRPLVYSIKPKSAFSLVEFLGNIDRQLSQSWFGTGGLMASLTRKFSASLLAVALILTLIHPPVSASANPTAPQITHAIGGNKVGYVEWIQAPDTITQKVLVYNSAGTSVVWEMQLSSGQTSFLLGPTDSFTNGTTYRVEIQALVNSQWVASDKAGFTPQASAPSGTTSTSIIQVQAYDQSAQVYFAKDESATKYFVGAFPNNSSLTPSRMIEVSAADVKGALSPSGVFENSLTNVDIHYFSVVALNSNGLGSWSPRTGAGTYTYVYPRNFLIKPPTSVSATAGTMQATVQWSAPSSPSVTIQGYDVEYTTNGGSSWISERFLGTATNAVIELSEGETPTHFRVAALGMDVSFLYAGGFSPASSPISPNKSQQTITWTPSTTSSRDLSTGISMEPLATNDSDNLLTYSVANAGSAGCSISINNVVEATSYGTCRIRVDAAASPRYAGAYLELVFSFVDPNAVQSPPSSGSWGGGGPVAIEKELSAPKVLGFSIPPSMTGSLNVGDRLTVSKLKFEKPKSIVRVKYLWYRCGSEVQLSSQLGPSCSPRLKSDGRRYVLKKSDVGSFLTVVIKAKTKQGSIKALLSSKAPVQN